MTEAQIVAYLKRAPVPKRDGPEAERIAKKIACDLFPSWNLIDPGRVSRFMRDHWLPRTALEWDFAKLFTVVEEAKQESEKRKADEAAAVVARRTLSTAARHKAQEDEATAERAALAKRESDAEKVTKIMAATGVVRRQAQRLYRDGTTIPEQAEKIAEALGTDPSEHLRRKAKSGRTPDSLNRFMRGFVPGCSWCDWIEEAAETDDKLAGLFWRGYSRRDASVPDHFYTFEELARYAQPFGFELPALMDSWLAYQVWRVRTMADRTILAIKPHADEDDFDFG